MDNSVIPAQSDIELTALLPDQMVKSQQALIIWCDGKIATIKAESTELKEAFEHAKMMKWRHTTLQNQYGKSLKRISYYEKIKLALLAGYYIIPNFDVDVFAIRTTKDKPAQMMTTYRHSRQLNEQLTHDVPIGEGEYRDSRPEIHQHQFEDKTVNYWAESWNDVDFPLNMAKPIIMHETSRAMDMKIFDQIGVFPSRRKKVDPVIIGRVVFKEGRFKERTVSFMIAWHLNTNVL